MAQINVLASGSNKCPVQASERSQTPMAVCFEKKKWSVAKQLAPTECAGPAAVTLTTFLFLFLFFLVLISQEIHICC